MDKQHLRQTRFRLLIFMAGLIVSGLTAMPIQWEIDQIKHIIDHTPWLHDIAPGWVDWLAFAPIVIALAFISPLHDPIRNVWVIEFGMIACALVIPAALIFGALRSLPFLWQLLDCSFGVIGIIPLLLAYRLVKPYAAPPVITRPRQ